VQQAQARKTALDADLTRAAARVDELGREGTRLEAGLKDLRTTRDRVASEIETASAQRELLQAEVATLTEAVAVQRAESSTLANLLTAAKAELTETRGELNAKRGELTEASIKLDEMRALKDSIVRPVKVPEGEVSLKPDAEAADEATGAISPAFPAAGSILPPPRPPAKTLQRTPRRPAPVVREAALPARVSPPKPQARRSEPAEVAEETDREETEVAPRTSPTRRNRASERGYAELSRVPAGALELPDSLLPLRPPASGPRTQFPDTPEAARLERLRTDVIARWTRTRRSPGASRRVSVICGRRWLGRSSRPAPPGWRHSRSRPRPYRADRPGYRCR
jgi:hypothetical protein